MKITQGLEAVADLEEIVNIENTPIKPNGKNSFLIEIHGSQHIFEER